MPERVYIETTVVSYLTARPSRDLIVAGHQQLTHEWWNHCRANYELCVSQLVLQEAGEGDAVAAQERLEVLAAMTVLEITEEAVVLAEELVQIGVLPSKAGNDALHIAVAAIHRVPFLLTWNCRHLANATIRRQIEAVFARKGRIAPIICTPEELNEVKS
jgi:predicted nucleic acid-binding protein